MKMNRVFLLYMMAVMVWSCKKDDSGPEVVPPKLLSEVVTEDAAKIKTYLETHFYNYEEFENPPVDFDYRIKLDTIAGDNADKKSLFSLATQKKVKRSSSDLNLPGDEKDIEHILYYISARGGKGESPTIADSTYVRYEGSLLKGTIFDSSLKSPVWFDLPTLVEGFARGVAHFKSGGEIIENGDGTYEVKDYGVGIVFMPSGLGYFNVARAGIPAYSPLIFKIDLFAINKADHDRDGVPSINEDADGDGNIKNDDTDEDGFPNYLDSDDDGDGKLTKDEIRDTEGNITFPDSDDDGIKDYLDSDS